MPIAEITAALSATNGALKILKGINETAKNIKINEAVIELQGTLIDLNRKILLIQGEYESLTNIKSKLEAELRKEKERNNDRIQYELRMIGSGNYVYSFTGKGSPPHDLCATCFDENQKTILQCVFDGGRSFYKCGRSDSHSFFLLI